MSDERGAITRREFTALSLAAGVAAGVGVGVGGGVAAGAAAGAAGTTRVVRAPETDMIDTDVRITTAAGVCDAALIHPSTGSWPGVILFTDVFGLRPAMRDLAKRLAAVGFTVLVPNPFYRSAKPPGLSIELDFNNPVDRAKIDVLRAPLCADAVMQDAKTYVKFLDSQPAVRKNTGMGVFGYCMGGPMALQAAAANPARIGAGASFHGGGLVTAKPDSPHLLASKMKAQFYFGIAMNDDQRQPEAKMLLAEAFQAAKLPAKIEVYEDCLHGWCVKDTPRTDGRPAVYNSVQADRAWGELVALYARAENEFLTSELKVP